MARGLVNLCSRTLLLSKYTSFIDSINHASVWLCALMLATIHRMTMRTDLDHLPDDKQRFVQTIREVILNEFERLTDAATGKKQHSRIKHIILFGSYAKGGYVDDPANGYISDYDILITLNNDHLLEEYTLWNTIEDKAERRVHSPVNLIIHTMDDVGKQLQEGRYFFSDIQQDGICLYSQEGKGLPEPKVLTNAERKPVAQQHFGQRFENANTFFKYAKEAITNKDNNYAAFNLHQAAERYYQTLLLVLTNYHPKTHNIKRLHPLAIQYAKEVETVFPQDTRFKRRCFDRLKRAYVDARYSEHYIITEEELSWLAEQVNQLKRIVEATCKAHIDSL